MIAAVVLAAGLSRRMGNADKLLLPVNGRPLYAHVLTAGCSSLFGARFAVTNVPALAAAARAHGYTVIPSPRASDGMGFSVAAGAAALPGNAQAAVFLNADQPFVPEALLNALVSAWRAHGGIIVPTLNGAPRAPVLFDRRYFAALTALTGETGGRSVYRAHMDDVTLLPWADAAAFRDIDTPADYERLTT